MHWQKITLVGIGLLGGSLGLAAKRRGLAGTVEGYVRRTASVDECLQLGVVDAVGLDLEKAVTGADLVVLCTPLAQMKGLTKRMLSALQSDAIVTDVGSVKASVARDLESLVSPTGAHFIGSHPMAGAEKMGVAASRADLFEGATCVVTPTAKANGESVDRLMAFWQAVGAMPVRMSAEAHDALVSRSSHLPHFAAAALVNCILDPSSPAEQSELCATGFGDTTRVASGSPEMWRDIAQANSGNLSQALGDYIHHLQRVREALDREDDQVVLEFLETAKQRRDVWRAKPRSTSTE